jgi:hypothetical protein
VNIVKSPIATKAVKASKKGLKKKK